uniref:Uncharacterized protein n=1 Tax=Arundo donax TaxID=35708 RepID=A0A0A8ZI18_ARUDO
MWSKPFSKLYYAMECTYTDIPYCFIDKG